MCGIASEGSYLKKNVSSNSTAQLSPNSGADFKSAHNDGEMPTVKDGPAAVEPREMHGLRRRTPSTWSVFRLRVFRRR